MSSTRLTQRHACTPILISIDNFPDDFNNLPKSTVVPTGKKRTPLNQPISCAHPRTPAAFQKKRDTFHIRAPTKLVRAKALLPSLMALCRIRYFSLRNPSLTKKFQEVFSESCAIPLGSSIGQIGRTSVVRCLNVNHG